MPKFVIKEGPGKGDAFEVSQPQASIGRDADNTYRLADKTVSRYHARITQRDGDCWVSDLDSHNGTMVNGRRIDRERLQHMDEIRFGNVTLIYLEDEVTDMDVLIEGEGADPEVTQAFDLDEAESIEDVDEASRSELITSNRRLRTLNKLARSVTGVRSLPPLFDLTIDSINETLDPDHVVPIMCQEDGPLLPYVRAKSGFEQGLEEAGISKKLVDHCLKKGVAALSKRPSKSSGTTSMMCVPLMGDVLHGVLCCDRTNRSQPYERADLQYLCSLSALVAVAIENVRAYEDLAARARTLEREVEGQYNLVGQSPQIEKVFEFIRKAAPTEASVLICGESGTGKELVARAIHYHSNREEGPFEAVNCAAMNETLIESELFGHVKGAFTGAINDRPGRFELANKGAMFLDEIGSLPLDCQTKLLRVLEVGTVRRVGDVKDRELDVRVIAATNENLDEAKEEGTFREDLFYRLNVLRTDLPPLKKRGGDIDLLAHHFLNKFREKTGRRIEGFDPRVLEVFRQYSWPGNVRELKNVVERMVIMCEGDQINTELLPPELETKSERSPRREVSPAASPGAMQPLNQVEQHYIMEVLRRTEGNKKRAAEILGIDRSTLYAKLKRYQEKS